MTDGYREQPHRRPGRLVAVLIVVLVTLAPPASPPLDRPAHPGPPPPFEAWLAAVREEAVHRGYERRFVNETLTGVQPLARVVRADRGQAEVVQTLDHYLAVRVTPELIAEGQRLIGRHRLLLARVERAYGVPAQVVVAIWGAETGYGRYTGDVPVLAALATLAWTPRRSHYFRGELFAALRLLADEGIARKQMVGSWAGAVGQPQFMPSSYLRYAVDFDGDGRRDLWQSAGDTLASIANYLREFGWRYGETWGGELMVTAALRSEIENRIAARQQGCAAIRSLTPLRPLAEWFAAGAEPLNGARRRGTPAEASLLALDGRAFLVGRNYEAILGYNCSHRYALSVSLLADALQDAGAPGRRVRRATRDPGRE